MIVLLVILALVFAWACISTGVAVAQAAAAELLRTIVQNRDERIGELEDRAQASSLSELRVHRPVAMQAAEQAPDVEYLYDATGLNRSVVPARDHDDE